MENFYVVGLLLFLMTGLICVIYASDESLYRNDTSFNLGYGIASDTTLNRISLFGEESDLALNRRSHFSTFESSDEIDTERNSYDSLGGFYVELGGSSDPDTILGGTGVWAEVSDYITLKGGLSLLASESFDDTFTGGNLDLHISFGSRFSPYVGAGIFAGYSRERVSADDDDIDNDGDGFVDERGEEKTVVKDVIASVYPEAGFYIWITDDLKLSFSGKYYVTTEGREDDFWIFSSGFNFTFH